LSSIFSMLVQTATANASAIVTSIIFIMGVIFHAGYVYSRLNWLTKHAVTKEDIAVLKASLEERVTQKECALRRLEDTLNVKERSERCKKPSQQTD